MNLQMRSVGGLRCGILILTSLICATLAQNASGQVLTRSYDNSRSGANTHETTLTPANVGNLKKLREIDLPAGDDPRIEAQPLYVPQLQMVDGKKHDVVIVCTMADNVYAFDMNTGARIWKADLGKPISPMVTGTTPNGQKETAIDLFGINLRWGILSTPVIDIDTKILYVVAWTSPDGSQAKAMFKLDALNISSGLPVHPALVIQASQGQNAKFNPANQKQRAALLLTPLRQPAGPHVKKTLFMACGMTSETAMADHGWVIAFDVDSFQQKAAWTPTPQSHTGGIWQGSQGPASDDQGNVFLLTGNGGWNGTTDFAESFIRLHYTPGVLAVADWFTPFHDNQRPNPGVNGYDFTDQDLGSGAAILPPSTNLVVGGGKDGVLYVFDRGNLGKLAVNQNTPNLADNKPLLNAVFFTYFPGNLAMNPLVNVNSFPDGKTHHIHGSPLAWSSEAHGTMLFVWGENASLRSWTLAADGKLTFLGESAETASAFSTIYNAMPGGMITLSASNGKNGIVWGTVPVKGNWDGHDNNGNANQEIVEGVLRAYDATAMDGTNANGNPKMKLLWQSTTPGNPRPGDTRFTYDKFCPPVVADGKVLLPTYDAKVIVYGL